MVDDPGAEQARLLLETLHAMVATTSRRLEVAEMRGVRTSVRGGLNDRRGLSDLRCDLYEAHRLIRGLHRRYPETVDSWEHAPAADVHTPHA